jgi:hypothetical protein
MVSLMCVLIELNGYHPRVGLMEKTCFRSSMTLTSVITARVGVRLNI